MHEDEVGDQMDDGGRASGQDHGRYLRKHPTPLPWRDEKRGKIRGASRASSSGKSRDPSMSFPYTVVNSVTGKRRHAATEFLPLIRLKSQPREV